MLYNECVQSIVSAVHNILENKKTQELIQIINHKPQSELIRHIEYCISTTIINELQNYMQKCNVELIHIRGLTYDIILTEEVNFGTLKFDISLDSNQLNLNLTFLYEENTEQYSYTITNIIKKLCMPNNDKMVHISSNKNKNIIIIDFEWLQLCYKTKKIAPLITEFGVISNDNYFYSGHLWIHPLNLKKVNYGLLRALNTTKEELQLRHKKGLGINVTWNSSVIPILNKLLKKNKEVIFLTFGDNDHAILKELLDNKYNRQIKYCDFREVFQTQLGQESLLQGLGVEFTHNFHSGQDAKALNFLFDIFSQNKNINETQTLECLIRLNRNIILDKQQEISKFYMNLFLNDENNKKLWERQTIYTQNLSHKLLDM